MTTLATSPNEGPKDLLQIILDIIWQKIIPILLAKTPIGRAVERKKQIVESINPKNFNAAQVGGFFGLPTGFAEFMCRLAVKHRRFTAIPTPEGQPKSFSLSQNRSEI